MATVLVQGTTTRQGLRARSVIRRSGGSLAAPRPRLALTLRSIDVTIASAIWRSSELPSGLGQEAESRFDATRHAVRAWYSWSSPPR